MPFTQFSLMLTSFITWHINRTNVLKLTYYMLLLTHYRLCSDNNFSTNLLVLILESTVGYCIVFSCHFSLVCDSFSIFCLFFLMTLTVLKITDQVLCRTSHSLCLMLDCGYRWYHDLLMVMLTFITWFIKTVSARLLS